MALSLPGKYTWASGPQATGQRGCLGGSATGTGSPVGYRLAWSPSQMQGERDRGKDPDRDGDTDREGRRDGERERVSFCCPGCGGGLAEWLSRRLQQRHQLVADPDSCRGPGALASWLHPPASPGSEGVFCLAHTWLSHGQGPLRKRETGLLSSQQEGGTTVRYPNPWGPRAQAQVLKQRPPLLTAIAPGSSRTCPEGHSSHPSWGCRPLPGPTGGSPGSSSSPPHPARPPSQASTLHQRPADLWLPAAQGACWSVCSRGLRGPSTCGPSDVAGTDFSGGGGGGSEGRDTSDQRKESLGSHWFH